ncbi:double-strand break repair helicase AddA, partial [Propylenella binzhouense]
MSEVPAPDPLARTQRHQRAASDPGGSAWVVANAGSGKTHVLTLRVIRLLLAGAEPASILCLTFTRTAAAEMARRVFDTLGRWATMPDGELGKAIAELEGREPRAGDLARARRLFADALETPGGLKIQTIHAFCERLLHQFPLEANAPAHFEILDDTGAAALLAEAQQSVMGRARDGGALADALRRLAETTGDAEIAKALSAIIACRDDLRRWFELAAPAGEAGGLDDVLADLRRRLGLDPDDTEESLCRAVCAAADWPHARCRELSDRLAEALAKAGHSYDRRAAEALGRILAAASAVEEARERCGFFLSWDKEASDWRCYSAKQRFGAAFKSAMPGLEEAFVAEAERLVPLLRRLLAVRTFDATAALLRVGDAILDHYRAAKNRLGFLDYDDLIVRTRNLLSRADAAEWVLYKLDARIRHILVDEAQDTSPAQWEIVKSLAGDFFSGAGAVGSVRSMFAVGDDKQSIFGFQGAAPRMLSEMEAHFRSAAEGVEHRFVHAPLSLSFRSTAEVLAAVDKVFSGELEESVTTAYEPHSAHRLDEPGDVVLWPRIAKADVPEPEDWTTPLDAPTQAEAALAERIAEEIGRLVGGEPLRSGKRVRPGGILVLSRKRDAFVVAMHRALKARGIPAAGADRVAVATHIAALDCLALADVMLMPEDDLQLAAVLKSPLVGLDEEALMEVAAERGRRSLWRALGAAEAEPHRAAYARLAGWRSMADQVTPFRFFATVLGPDGGRRAFRSRLGSEADDVLDALLGEALAYEQAEPPTLQGFAAYLRAGTGDIKRELDETAAGVRVMTVHGAKGLEADVVFLVDGGGRVVHPSHRGALVPIGGRGDPAFVWRRRDGEALRRQYQADAEADREATREYRRLLYVGMTRARDRLYVCGVRARKEVEGCWYDLVARALLPADIPRDENAEIVAPFVWGEPLRPPRPPAGEERGDAAPPAGLPGWLRAPAPSPPP